MPTATLLTAATFTIGGDKFFKDKERNVTPELARYLDENEAKAFRVRMHKVIEEVAPPPPPVADEDDLLADRPAFSRLSMKAAILAAADYLNPDIEGNFEADGRPTAKALTAVMQRVMTEEDRDAAFAVDPGKTTHPDAEAAARAAKRNLTIKKRADASTEGAIAV